MNLTLCGSIAFIHEMDDLRQKLEALGHSVQMPPMTERIGEHGQHISADEYYALKKAADTDLNHWIWKNHGDCISAHFRKIEWADAVVILNLSKNNIEHYVGPNTLMEMGYAFALNKPIYLFNPIPRISYFEELIGMNPIIISGDLSLIHS
jgi:nucleoside 2-deoxyribosyltransferase